MNLIDLLWSRRKAGSASIAKERLQVIVAHERSQENSPDFLPELQRELMAVIAKYVHVNTDQVSVEFEKRDGRSILELNVTLPERKEL